MEKAMVMAISKDAQFIWSRTSKGEDKWVERFFVREIDAYGNIEWRHQHSVSYIDTEAVDGFAKRLSEIGFKIVDSDFPVI